MSEAHSSQQRLPRWMKMKLPKGESYSKVKNLVNKHELHTICTSGNCPNIGECWNRGTATFMILGEICTRNCKFCGVTSGKPLSVDPNEAKRVAESVRIMELKHAVITSVDRDDLPDLGAEAWASTITAVKQLNPNTKLEVLIPDFQGKKEQGILNNLDLQFENECARHKLLDIVGDLSLAGRRIKGRIIATKPGHKVNTEFAKLLKKEIRKFDTEKEIPRYDCSQKPLMSVNDIKTFLPHRFPFLLVDKIVEIKDNYIVGVKNVTANEPFFQGHFPDEPIMPGVLLIEAMAQCGGLYVLHDKKEKYSTYFIRVDNVKFRQKVVPGDTLLFKVELVSPIRRGIANMKGTTYIGDKIVAEGDFMAQIVKA